MKLNEKVSIIIPAFNVENKIERCFNSLKNQDYKNIEVVFVDDGSTDKTLEILKELCDNNSKYKIISKENGGVSSARNLGIEKATGKYIMFVDSDDYVEKNMVSTMIKCSNENNTEFTMCGLLQEYYKDNKIIKVIEKGYKNNLVLDFESESEIIINMIQSEYINGPYCKLFNREIIENKNIRFNTQLKIQEDLDFNIRYINEIKKIGLLSNNLYHYTIEGNTSITSKFMPERFDNYSYVQNKVFKLFEHKSISKEQREKLYYISIKNAWSAVINTYYSNNNMCYKKRNVFIKRILKKLDYEIIKKSNRKGIIYKALKFILLTKNAMLVHFFSFIMYNAKKLSKLSYK